MHALVLLAGIELELQNVETGRELLDRALAAAEAADLPPLEMYALHAGANLLSDEPLSDVDRSRALEYNPRYGDVFAIPAHFYIITYRYREAVDLYRRAVALDDTLASAHRDLGINLLRINDVFGARHHLARAFDLDPFDIMTVNTLRLLDDLDGMRVTQRGRAGSRRTRNDAARARARAGSIATTRTRSSPTSSTWSRAPCRPSRHATGSGWRARWSSSSTTTTTTSACAPSARPGIGLLGVTFGYLTAMDSPKARAPGEFHWGSTLWHEIAHVFTLEATGHRLPRWFSEGLSVYEEWTTGPAGRSRAPARHAARDRRRAAAADRRSSIAASCARATRGRCRCRTCRRD